MNWIRKELIFWHLIFKYIKNFIFFTFNFIFTLHPWKKQKKTTQSKSLEWRDFSKDSKLPRLAAVSLPSSSLQGKTFPMSPSYWPKNKARLLTSRIEPTETQSLKPKPLPEKDSNCIKEPQTTDLFCSVVELWMRIQLLRRNSFVTSSHSSQSTCPFTVVKASFTLTTWRSNSSLLSPHSGLSSSMVLALFMLLSKVTPKKYWTSLAWSSLKSTTREVSHQSDSLVLENKNVTITSERSVKSPLKLSSLTTNVTSLVWFLLVALISRTTWTKPICSIQDSNARSSTLSMFLMVLKMDSTKPLRNQLKLCWMLSSWRKKLWFLISLIM